MEGRLVWFGGGFTVGMLFQTGGLAYDTSSQTMDLVSLYFIFHFCFLFVLFSYF